MLQTYVAKRPTTAVLLRVLRKVSGEAKGILQVQIVFVRRWLVSEPFKLFGEVAIVRVATANLVDVRAQQAVHNATHVTTHFTAEHNTTRDHKPGDDAEHKQGDDGLALLPQTLVETMVFGQQVLVHFRLAVLDVEINSALLRLQNGVWS